MVNIFRQQFLDTLCFFATPFVGLRFATIWQLKAYLKQNGESKHRLLARVYASLTAKKGSSIGVKSTLAATPTFPHDLFGIFISEGATIGSGCTIFQHVTIGSNTLTGSNHLGSPTIGNNVFIGAGAKIIGSVTIGDNCRIGANAVVVKDMPPHSVAVNAPTRIIQKENLENRHRSLPQMQSECGRLTTEL